TLSILFNCSGVAPEKGRRPRCSPWRQAPEENRMSALPVTHEPASQRRHFRICAPAEVCVEGLRYPTLDWSLGGFKIARYAGNASVCERLHVEFVLDFQGFRISFHANAEVLRRDDGQLAARWVELGERESSLLHRFVSDVMGGRLAGVDGVLKH